MLGIKIWETPLSWHAKCPLPVVVRVSKPRVLKLPIVAAKETAKAIRLLHVVKQSICSSRRQFRRIIIYMKKLLDSDWPRAVQFKCNTSAKSVIQCKLHIAPVQILHIAILDYD